MKKCLKNLVLTLVSRVLEPLGNVFCLSVNRVGEMLGTDLCSYIIKGCGATNIYMKNIKNI